MDSEGYLQSETSSAQYLFLFTGSTTDVTNGRPRLIHRSGLTDLGPFSLQLASAEPWTPPDPQLDTSRDLPESEKRGGIIKNNHFDGVGMTASTAWINVKGNAWTIDANEGKNSPQDGYQTHNILDQWGDYNLFTNNTGSVDGSGYAFAATPVMHNTIACSNTITGAGKGLSNIPCSNQ